MKQYPILRSGFVGFSLAGMKKPNSPFNDIAAALLAKERLAPDNDNFYHENVQKLFVQMLKEAQSNILNDFAMQENILKASAEAFGTKNFWDWIELQINAPTVTSVHQAFLIETLDYLRDIPRKTHIQQWIRLLEATSSEDRTTIRPNKFNDRIRQIRAERSIPAQMSEVFVLWLQKESGYYDFLVSMEAIFGNRRSIVG